MAINFNYLIFQVNLINNINHVNINFELTVQILNKSKLNNKINIWIFIEKKIVVSFDSINY